MRGSYGEHGEFYPENTDCEATGICPFPEPYQDRHHVFYEANKYQTTIERRFRELGENVLRICRCKHMEIHITETPPYKPSRCHMVEQLEQSDEHMSRSVRKAIKDHKGDSRGSAA